MDKSKKFIRMCESAKEIQQKWKQEYGDFFVAESGQIKCWISRAPAEVKFKKGFGITVDADVIYIAKYIWLPRQNQLIEMAQIPGHRYEIIVQNFYSWTKEPYEMLNDMPNKLFRTMEQIWLAFVMQQKFNKQWNDTQWLKRPLTA